MNQAPTSLSLRAQRGNLYLYMRLLYNSVLRNDKVGLMNQIPSGKGLLLGLREP